MKNIQFLETVIYLPRMSSTRLRFLIAYVKIAQDTNTRLICCESYFAAFDLIDVSIFFFFFFSSVKILIGRRAKRKRDLRGSLLIEPGNAIAPGSSEFPTWLLRVSIRRGSQLQRGASRLIYYVVDNARSTSWSVVKEKKTCLLHCSDKN